MRQIKDLKEIADLLAGSKMAILHSGVAEPQLIGDQLFNGAEYWPGLVLETLMSPGPSPYCDIRSVTTKTLVPGSGLREAVNDGRAEVIRESLFEYSHSLETEDRRCDVLFLQVSPPDAQGQVSLGPCVSFIPQILDQRPIVIAVINSKMPHTSYRVPMSVVDYAIYTDVALPEIESANISAVDQLIAKHVSTLLGDNITLEFGIGSVPEAVMRSVGKFKNLNIHTGLINESIMRLVQEDVVETPIVTTMAMGTTSFYSWLDRNNSVDFQPITHTHCAQVLAAIPKFYAVNGAVQVDLLGNVNAERVGGRIISCPGGLPDFAKGAKLSKGGKSIIALRSMAGRTRLSTIVPRVDCKTLSGSLVDAVVTEYGVAELTGKNDLERGAALTAIAHPDHR